MKFSCSQTLLAKGLNIVSKAVSTRTTMPVLKGILLSVDDNNCLTMSASDMDLSITNKMLIEEGEPGATVVPAKLFNDIIRKLPNETVYIDEESNAVKIKCANSEFKLMGFYADEFPRIDENEGNDYISLESETLKEMIRMTSFCASTDEQRKIMTGILLEINASSFNMVASDGFRLALAHTETVNEDYEKLVIPQKILSEIGKIIQEAETDEKENKLKLYVSDKKAKFEIGNINVFTGLLAGEFLKYQNFIPTDNQLKIRVNRNSLLDAIERASLMARIKKNNLVKLYITENLMEITSNSEEGDAKECVYVESESVDTLTIGFNSKYLSDALKAIDDDEVLMEFKKSNNPCLIKPVEGDAYKYLVFPIRIQG